jgi:hypothetical protein
LFGYFFLHVLVRSRLLLPAKPMDRGKRLWEELPKADGLPPHLQAYLRE